MPQPKRVSKLAQRAVLLLDAARSAKLSQLAARPRRLVPPSVMLAGLRVPIDVEWHPAARGLGVEMAPQSGPTAPPHEVGAFAALGLTRSFPAPGFWNDDSDGLLFLFHLHGFSRLADYAAGPQSTEGQAFWSSVLESWLATKDRPARPGWHPHPTSLRLIAWSSALPIVAQWSGQLGMEMARELWRQGRYLARSIEHDIGGNHVLKNATALCFAGAVVPQSELLNLGLRLLERELPRQMLPDGGHEERSTSYHRAITHDLEEVCELLRRIDREVPGWLSESTERAHQWQLALTGPDGLLPLLNDAWDGPALAGRCTDEVTVLEETGYVVLRHHDDQVVINAGPLCPAHLPPHAHAHALSFVLWMDGRPVVVDPGSYSYSGPERDAFRGTRAHNTVEVDDEDQCVFWGDFRAGALPRIGKLSVRNQGETTIVEVCHDGYRRLPDPVVHHRAFVWWRAHGLTVVDWLECREAHTVRSSLCLHPDVALDTPGLGIDTLGSIGAREESRRYAPALGRTVTQRGLVMSGRLAAGHPVGWSLLRATDRVELIDGQELQLDGGNRVPQRVRVLNLCATRRALATP